MKKPADISVILADSQFLTRKALKSLLEELPGFRLLAQLDTPDELCEKMATTEADLLILALWEEATAFIEQLEKIERPAGRQILILSNTTDPATIQRLTRMGIRGIIHKNCSEREIVSALRAVSIGKRFYCNSMLDLLMESEPKQKAGPELSALSARELQVLKLIAKGCTTRLVAEKLHISVHTVNSHRKNILKKLHISSPIHLLAFAVEKGLVRIDKTKS